MVAVLAELIPPVTVVLARRCKEVVEKKKKGRCGGHGASLHSAMFDSAWVRGVLRCYDNIDCLFQRAVLSW